MGELTVISLNEYKIESFHVINDFTTSLVDVYLTLYNFLWSFLQNSQLNKSEPTVWVCWCPWIYSLFLYLFCIPQSSQVLSSLWYTASLWQTQLSQIIQKIK